MRRSRKAEASSGWAPASPSCKKAVFGAGLAAAELRPGRSPVPEALRHELARLQDALVRRWLCFRDEPDVQDEVRELNARELAVGHVSVRPARLGKLHTGAAVWRYDEPGADFNVPDALSLRWPLEHRCAP